MGFDYYLMGFDYYLMGFDGKSAVFAGPEYSQVTCFRPSSSERKVVSKLLIAVNIVGHGLGNAALPCGLQS